MARSHHEYVALCCVAVCVAMRRRATCGAELRYRARQLYKNISMLFLFPVKDGKLSTI